MGLRDAGDPRELLDVERVGVSTVDRVPGAKHAAIELLDGAGHPTMLVAA
jgi:hypothetical protein